jgi:predicted O-linked N-acetylglucosamine transferase (SPINDLY family)
VNLLETAIQHHRGGELAEAERLYREVLARDANHWQAAFHLGVLALQSGRLDEAVEMLARATALAPDSAACHTNLGEAQRRSGHLADAYDSLLNAIARNPDVAAPFYNLALVLHERGAIDGALASLRLASELQPSLPDIQARLTAAQAAVSRRGTPANDRRIPDAEDLLSAATLVALARPLALKGRLQNAVHLLRRAVQLHPSLVAAHCNLGVVHAALGEFDQAAASYRQALEIEPDQPDTHYHLGNTLLRGGLMEEATSSFRRAIALTPEDASRHSDLLFVLPFHPAYNSRTILAEARAWDLAHARPLAPQCADVERDRTPDRRLRIGYVSPNFRQHCQAFFMVPLLAHHDHERFEIFCYSDVARPDEWTDRLLGHADRWINIQGVDHAAVADRIRDDRIDILVDLTMHMSQNRLLVFARKPAPVQVCWLAYPGTTGLAAIDYRVTDPYLDPTGTEADDYAEQPLRLPDTFWCYDPLTGEDGVGPLPARQHGHIRFGSLNNFFKVNEIAIALWARVMREVGTSRLTLLAPVGDARTRTADLFERQGIDRARLEFVDYQPRLPYLATYQSIDVCLDTFPYNGHTTSLDALWMGVPVVTLVGSTVVGRAGLCQAMNLRLPELVARTPDEYVKIVLELCSDLDRLSELRAGMRARMKASPLMDAPRFARNLEAAYRRIWRRWCEGDP